MAAFSSLIMPIGILPAEAASIASGLVIRRMLSLSLTVVSLSNSRINLLRCVSDSKALKAVSNCPVSSV